MTIKRFGVSLETELLQELDKIVLNNRFPSRSQAIRSLIQKNAVEKKWQDDQIVLGTVVIVYDHHKKELHKQINALQHEYHCLLLAGQHLHIDDHNRMEIIALKGKANRIQNLANKLKAIKGIKHADLLKTGMG
ncbi:MAG: nickel-responsive transcriptional regulator NikR [Bacteroidota bacterium]